MNNPIAQAVEPRRAAALQNAEERAKIFIDAKVTKLSDAGFDLNAVAPNPNTMMSRKDYMTAKNLRAMFSRFTKDANHKAANAVEEHALSMKRDRNQAPDLVTIDYAGVEKFIADRREMADAEFTSYIAKLTAKVDGASASPVFSASLDGGALWSYSYLTIERADQTKETWKTQMILNVSVLGTLFNQWPTRRVK